MKDVKAIGDGTLARDSSRSGAERGVCRLWDGGLANEDATDSRAADKTIPGLMEGEGRWARDGFF
jgi:hypothetical protein